MTNLHGMTSPTCDILVNGQKRKLYGKNKNKVYLHNGDNFQLQIFNPLQERIGVQLCMNGQKVDDDLLVINPGQEIIIERYIGTNRKMTFSAYDIDTSKMSESRVKEAKKAIEKNGILEVVFWNEKKPVQTIFTTSTTVFPNYIPIPNYPTTNPNWITSESDKLYDSSHSISSITSGGTAADITISASDVVINGNLKINGSLDINNGQLIITGKSSSSGTSGASGTSGTSGSSGVKGSRGFNKTNISTTETDYSQYLAENTDANINYSQYIADSTSANFMSIDSAPQEMSRGIIDSDWNRRLTGDLKSLGMDKLTAKWNPIKEKKIETGRIEKGGVSNQYFTPIQFEIGDPFYKIKFKLLPFSLKPVKKKLYDSTTIKNVMENNTYIKSESSIREYCKCGYRISRGKGTWNFCPMCNKKIKK